MPRVEILKFTKSPKSDKQNPKTINYQRINAKLQVIQDMTTDLADLAKNLNIKNAVANIQFDNNADVYLMEKTYKMALIADVIASKAQMMQGALNDAKNELRTKPKFCETLPFCEIR